MEALDPAARVAVVAAMVPELRPIVRALKLEHEERPWGRLYRGRAGGHEIVAVVTSMGTEAATDITNALLDEREVDHVIMVGIAGAIAPEVEIGHLVVPEVVVHEATGTEHRPRPLGGPAKGKLLTTDVLHNDPSELDALIEQGFVAVDMETAAVGAVCRERGIPWSAFRAISDRAGDAFVDADVVALSKPDGSAAPKAIAKFVVTRPWHVPKLATLGRGMNKAVAASTDAVLRVLR